MFRKIAFLACIFLLSSVWSYSQSKAKGKVKNEYFNITFGTKLQLDKEYRPQRFIARPEGGYLIQSFGKGEKSMGLDVVTEKFEQSASKMHDIRRDYDRRDEQLVYFGGRALWVNSSYDSKTKDEKAFLQEINDDNGDLTGDEIQINKTQDVASGIDVAFSFSFFMGGASGASMAITQSDRYFYSISPDSSKLLVYYRKKKVKKSDRVNKDVYGFIVVDDTYKVLWKKETELAKTEFMMKFYEAEVNNNGDVYYLAKSYKDDIRKYKKGAKPNYTLSLFELTKDSKKSKEKAMELPEGFLRETEFFINDEGKAVVCGTYGKQYKGTGSSGIFYNIVDMDDRKVSDAKFVDFESDLDAEYEGPKHAKKLAKIYKKYGVGYIPNLKFREVFFDEKSKSLYLILESYHLEKRTSNSGRTTTYYYFYDDVYAVKVNTAKQQIDKAFKIPKRQLGINIQIDLGISSFMFGENLYVFFIDNKKNLELKPDMLPAEHRSTAGGFLSGVHVDFEKGDSPQRFLLYDAKVEKKYCDPQKFITSNGVIYGVGYEKPKGGGPYYPIKIDFK